MTSDTSPSDHTDAPADEIQVIAIRLGRELFCLNILEVSEIVRTTEFSVTRVPYAHAHVQGVVNLRGKVIPVIDLARRLHLSRDAESHSSRMVVVEVDEAIVGLTVDSVSEVLRLPHDTFTDPDGDGGRVGTVNGQIMTLIRPAHLLAARDAADLVESADA